jgi:hypothetical protein
MYQSPSLVELDQSPTGLSDEECFRFQDEFLAATSSGWEQVMSVLQSYVRDPETRETLEELMAA